jgi:hypothetical protein
LLVYSGHCCLLPLTLISQVVESTETAFPFPSQRASRHHFV